jgi:hypothetical protein
VILRSSQIFSEATSDSRNNKGTHVRIWDRMQADQHRHIYVFGPGGLRVPEQTNDIITRVLDLWKRCGPCRARTLAGTRGAQRGKRAGSSMHCLYTLMSHQAFSPCTTTGNLKVPPEYLRPRLVQKYSRKSLETCR